VIDTHTGDVLAMATVDGEHIGATQSGPLEHNRAMTDVLEPGSTNKAIAVATALQDNLITPATQFSVPDQLVMGGQVFADDETHPVENMNAAQILTQSSNVGAIQIAARLGPVKLDQALRRFGLGSVTAAKFPGQSAGLMLPVSEYHDTGMGSVPIGYGLAVTPLQMLDVYATLANGGMSVPPRLVEATIGTNGKREDVPLQSGKRIVSKATASLVTQMLEGVVNQGTGACAAVTGFDVAGKTGTSRIPVSGGYSSSQHMASFVGYAPAEAPRVAAIVVLNSPDDVYGGRASAPVFSEIMSAALRTERVVPPAPATNPPQWAVANASAIQQRTSCLVPHGHELQSMLDNERATERAAAQQAAQAAAQAAYDRAHPNRHKQSQNHGAQSTTSTTATGTSTTSTSTPVTRTTGAGPPSTGTVPPTTAPNG
jgi:cell division protein FtsI (penicillin-binding protein 3)